MKKTISLALATLMLFAALFCCPVSASAVSVGDTITLIPLETGYISHGSRKTFSFNVPAESIVTLSFLNGDYYGDDDEDEEDWEEYETEGSVLVEIKNSNGKTVFHDSDEIEWDPSNFTVRLHKGRYSLVLTEYSSSGDDEDEDYYDYESFSYSFVMTAELLDDIQPTYLAMTKTKLSIPVGNTIAITGKYKPANTTVLPTWSSSNKKVVAVDSLGYATAKAFGTAKITLKMGEKSASCVVNVTTNKNAVRVFQGKTVSLKNRLVNVPGYEKAKWSTADKTIATVNQAGVVTGKTKGSTTITATIKNVKYTQKVSVKTPSVSLDRTTATIYKGDCAAVKNTSVTIRATTDPANQKITWTSSNTRIAKVSATGKVTPVAAGTATIKASFKRDGKTYSKSCKVTVKTKKALTAKVTHVDEAGIYNDCYVEFKNNSNKTITYITLNIKQYDNRGYKVSSPYDYYYLNESIKPNSTNTSSFWVNDDAKSAKVTITKVWFSDGTTYKPR